jgi:single-strand DNA-binding protein
MTINKVCLVGRLGANPESIWGESGCRTKASVSVRIDKDTSDWYNLTAFGKQAEILANYAKKGDQIAIEGRLQLNQWKDAVTNEPKSRAEVIIDKVTLLSNSRALATNS